MRRADRLFQLVQLVRGRRLSTAAFLALRLEVSERTVYRDVADLQRQGVPIEGEAGVGYRIGRGFDLPPLMFSTQEASALIAAIRMVQAWLDPALARDAEAALGKILSVLPTGTRAAAESTRIYAPPRAQDNAVAQHLQSLREAAQARHKVRLHYTTIEGEQSIRVVRPLGCFYWGSVWTLGAWCEKRQALRSFRVDLMASCECLDDSFMDEAGKTLADFLRSVGARLPGTGNT